MRSRYLRTSLALTSLAVLAGLLVHVTDVRAEGTAQTGTDVLMSETVLSVDVLSGDNFLNIAARNDENNDDLVVTVTTPGGVSTDYTLAPNSGELNNQNLPASIATPLRVAVTPGTYTVTFDHDVTPYDLSVSANDTDPIDPTDVPADGGRLFSTDWRFQGSLTEASPTYAFFIRAPVLDAEYLWKLNLEGLAGGYMCLVANELGLPGDLARTSQSDATLEDVTGLTLDRLDYCDDLAEYEMYVSPPTDRKPQPGVPELEFVGIAGCGAVLEGAGGSFEFTANMPSTYEIVIDTDRDGNFDPISDDAVLSGSAGTGTNFADWDGTDGAGDPVAASAMPYAARLFLRLGEFHFTSVDVETADPGISVSLVDPVTLAETPTVHYWDDRAIADNGEPDPEETLPDGTLQNHTWGDFGGDNGVGNNNYIDTWVFGQQVTQDTQVTVSDPSADADGDGLINDRECEIGSIFDDPDTDADGVPDGEEAPDAGPVTDTDGDDVPDVLDTDDDEDGIPTADESVDPDDNDSADDALDTDDDGVPNYLDDDDDDDGIPTAEEDLNDDEDFDNDNTDDDGVPNYLDPDDDGDGLPTADEDLNDDEDFDNDNTDDDGVPNYLDPDDDGDGIPTEQELEDAGNNPDLDNDGDPNWLDPDSDDDGIPDATESEGDGDQNDDDVPDYLDPETAPLDSDLDGIPDENECPVLNACPDTDNDGTEDQLDDDDDGDGVPTSTERPGGEDVDTDDDDTPDYLDVDDDGDGVPTAEEDLNDDDDRTNDDTDGDDAPNYLDVDDDGDGIPTAEEDLNDDDDRTNDDTDGDDVPNYLDPDDDDDGITTEQERQDAGETPDFDGDGVPNWLDSDSDADGLPDSQEAEGDGDLDDDGIPDYLDPLIGDGGVPAEAGAAPTEPDAAAPVADAGDAGVGVILPPDTLDAATATEPTETEPTDTEPSTPDAGSPEPTETEPEPTATDMPDTDEDDTDTETAPDAVLEGGGCSCNVPGTDSRSTTSWLAAVIALGALIGRRRRAVRQAVASGKFAALRVVRHWFTLLALFVVAGWSAQAKAQAEGIALDRFDPAERGSDWFNGESLDLREHNRWAVGGTLDWGYKPLVAYDANGDELAAIVRHQIFAHLGASVVLWDRVRFGLNLPLLVYQAGDAATSGGLLYQAEEGVALGDLRLGGDVRVFGHTTDAATLALGAQLFVPTGSPDSFAGDGKLRLVPRALLAGDIASFAYAARVSSALRAQSDNFAGQPFGAEMQFGAALGMRFGDRQWLLGPELWGSTVVSDGGDGLFEKKTTPFEGVLGVHYFPSEWRFGAGVGPGFTRGIGAPQVRVLLSAEWAAGVTPPPAAPLDTDGDGIWDSEDACVTEPGVPSTDPTKNGCPKVVEKPKDTDGDGIFDPQDACVTVPGEKNTDLSLNGCPPPDSDGDKILDRDDACPHEPGVASNIKEINGCPLPKDSDGDGINDDVDACPEQPGPTDPDPKVNGCPRAKVEGKQIVILDRVEFDTNKATIRPESSGILEAVLNVLQSHPEMAKVRIEGHTDNRGGKQHNLTLSRKRAAAVVEWLVAHGIDKARLVAEGVGQNRPIADNGSDEGRQTNRRVEFHIVKTDAPQP